MVLGFRAPGPPTNNLETGISTCITWQEFYAIVMAATAWGQWLAGCRIIAHW